MHRPAPWASTCRLDEPCDGYPAGDDERDGRASADAMSPRAICLPGDVATAVGHLPEGQREAASRAGSRWTMISDRWPVGLPTTSGGGAAGPGPRDGRVCSVRVTGVRMLAISLLDAAVGAERRCPPAHRRLHRVGWHRPDAPHRRRPAQHRAGGTRPARRRPARAGMRAGAAAGATRRPHPAAVALTLAAVRRATRQPQPILSRPTETAHPLRDSALKYPGGVYG